MRLITYHCLSIVQKLPTKTERDNFWKAVVWFTYVGRKQFRFNLKRTERHC